MERSDNPPPIALPLSFEARAPCHKLIYERFKMITMSFALLSEAEKLQYFEVATNSILQKLINDEIKNLEEQILQLDKRESESDGDFRRRFDLLSVNRKLLIDFYEINQQTITEIQNLQHT